MKIILVNYRFFISGGPERYMFNIIDELEHLGHTVVPFSVDHNLNKESKYEKFFLSKVGQGNEVYGHEYSRSLSTLRKVLPRMIYSFEAKRKFKNLVREVKPDIVYVLQFQNKISASVIDAAYEEGIPIVQRISDFAHFCVVNIFYNYSEKKICERCLKGSTINAIKYKCVNNSTLNSVIKVLALKVQKWRKTKEKISKFIIPAHFTLQKFLQNGVKEDKVVHIPTFFKGNKFVDLQDIKDEKFFLYVGRVDPDKGIKTLVDAFINTPFKLVIVGTSSDNYIETIKEYLSNQPHNISFTGFLPFKDIEKYLKTCICTILPTEWYDNMPNAVLESFAFYKPVIASEIGSMTEFVVRKETGLLFEPGNYIDLRKQIEYAYTNSEVIKEMGINANKLLTEKYSIKLHVSKLLSVFENVIQSHRIK